MVSSKPGTSTNDTFGGQYEVFLNFRGLDTRHGFTNCLKHALVDAGICVFFDDEAIRLGERLSDILLQAINDSKLYIPIFSKRYASSHWCLRELAKIIENSKSNENGKVILPIFYDVEPDDVKLKTGVGVYDEALSQLAEEKKQNSEEKKYNSEDVKTWRQALKEVSDTKGFKLKDYSGNHGDLIKAVVDEVLDRLQTRQRQVPKNFVGMEDCITAIDKLLDVDSEDVRLIVIYGMGGIGKTTLANVIFNKLCHRFGKNCSFLDDVRETAKQKEGLVKLQEKLLSDISYFKVDQNIKSTYHGMKRIGETICNKKMLIVLDDVDKGSQIENLIGVNSLYRGTRILVTTRDKSVLNTKEFKYIWKDYEMEGLSNEDALRLFSRHAFGDDSPPANYYDLSKGIVHTASGLPLALEVIGSYLCEKEKAIWEEWLERLKKTPHKDVLAKLKISYDALDENEKQIFLDIACYFAGENKTNPMYVWKDCDLYPEDAMDVLINRCMIKELDNNSLWMHDQFRDLGRKIARKERIGLWDEDDIIRELRSTEIKESVQALNWPWNHSRHGMTVTSEEIKRFPRMRFLWLPQVTLRGDFTGCLSELKWIDLGYINVQRLKATNFLHLENVVVANLAGIAITIDVLDSLIKGARKLKVLTMGCNTLISKTPTFPEYSNLEKLTINDGFYNFLMKIDCSIGKLRWLTDLRFKRCLSIKKLPEQIGELQNLQCLCLKYCYSLIELPEQIGELQNLQCLCLKYCYSLIELPASVSKIKSLTELDVSYTKVAKLPSTMSKLIQLQTLDLDCCHEIQELPELHRCLTTLRLESTSLLIVPNLSNLTNLVELVLVKSFEFGDTSNEIQTSDVSWIGMLSQLKKLHFCFPNVCAPTQLGSLSLLKELIICGINLPAFKQLPSNLIVLVLKEFRGKHVHLDGLPPSEKKTPSLPTSSGKSKENEVSEQLDVQFLDVLESSERSRSQDCRSSESLVCQPEEPGCSGLQAPELIDHWRGAMLFPSSQKMLVKFDLSGFPEVRDIQFVTALESLEEFYVRECFSLKSLGGLSNLKNLKQLDIWRCPSLQVVEGIDELEFLYELVIRRCRSVGRILDPSSSKIPDNCSILITGSGELPDCWNGAWDRWKSYREKILNRAKLAWSSEIETADSETGTGDSLQKTNQENKEKKRKRKTESAKQQGRRTRRKLQKKAWVRLFHPIIFLCRTRKLNRRRERPRQSAKEQKKRKRGKIA